MSDVSRREHIEWSKSRALEFCDAGDINSAHASLMSDLNKHDDTRGHPAIELLSIQLFSGAIKTPQQMRTEIEGFN